MEKRTLESPVWALFDTPTLRYLSQLWLETIASRLEAIASTIVTRWCSFARNGLPSDPSVAGGFHQTGEKNGSDWRAPGAWGLC